MADIEADVTRVLSHIASGVHDNLYTISEALTASIRAEIPSLDREVDLHRVLGSSVESNIANLQTLLTMAVDDDQIATPTSASLFARRLAQRNIPVGDLLRAYRIGQGQFMRWAYSELLGADDLDPAVVLEAGLILNDIAYRYVDRVSEHVLGDYAEERAALTRTNAAQRMRIVREVLDGEEPPIERLERTLDHRMRQRHLGAVLWLPDPDRSDVPGIALDRAVEALGRLGSGTRKVLAVPRDDDSIMVWLALDDDEDVGALAWSEVLGPEVLGDAVYAAVGDPAPGLDGFRSTMRGALRAHATVANVVAPVESVVRFRVVAPIAALAQDLASARSWVVETLGGLAGDDEQSQGFRETLAVFLHEAGSFQRAAKMLHVHKNTVAYRVRRAEELRGRAIGDDRLAVEIALLAAHWLGTDVLERGSGA